MRNMSAGAGCPATAPFNAAWRRHVAPAARRLDASIEHRGSTARLCLRGTLDMASAASVYDIIVASAAAPVSLLHVDLSGLEAATRAGCRAINVAAKLLHHRGGRLTIFGARPNVEPVLTNTGFDALIDFRDGIAPFGLTRRERLGAPIPCSTSTGRRS